MDNARELDAEIGRSNSRHVGADELLLVVADAVHEMTTFLTSVSEVDATLDRLCRDLVGTVSGADAAGVTVIRRGRPATTAYTDDLVLRVDRAQYDTGQGPCLEAAATQTMVRVSGGGAAERFPRFWHANTGSGIQSFLSTPVAIDDDHHGALNLYGRGDHGFGRLEPRQSEVVREEQDGEHRGLRLSAAGARRDHGPRCRRHR